jgi:hypothetical protein
MTVRLASRNTPMQIGHAVLSHRDHGRESRSAVAVGGNQ